MTSDAWNPTQYAKFAAEREQPFWDLLAMVDADAHIERMVDLGCGTGELTAAAAGRLGASEALGIDSSLAMLDGAAARTSGTVRFEHGDIATWTAAGEWDLVLANAAIQWVPDHAAVLARWSAAVRPGGWIAVQTPANSDHPSHLSSVEVAHREPFLSAMGGAPPPDPVAANVLRPEEYAAILDDAGFAPNVRLQVYVHRLADAAAVVEWTKGTSLTRFFKALPEEMHDDFVEEYRRELLRRVTDRAPYPFLFKRILMTAHRAE